MRRRAPRARLSPYQTLFRSELLHHLIGELKAGRSRVVDLPLPLSRAPQNRRRLRQPPPRHRHHPVVFCSSGPLLIRHSERSRPTFSSAFAPAKASACGCEESLFSPSCFHRLHSAPSRYTLAFPFRMSPLFPGPRKNRATSKTARLDRTHEKSASCAAIII